MCLAAAFERPFSLERRSTQKLLYFPGPGRKNYHAPIHTLTSDTVHFRTPAVSLNFHRRARIQIFTLSLRL